MVKTDLPYSTRVVLVICDLLMMMMMTMVYYCLSKKTPLLNTHTFTPVESELNALSAALAASKPLLAEADP